MVLLRVIAYGMMGLALFAAAVVLIDLGTLPSMFIGAFVSLFFGAGVLLGLDRIISVLTQNSRDTQRDTVPAE